MQENNNVNFNSTSYRDPAAAWTVKKGIKDAFPVFLGYAAVAFSLGITAGSAGFTAFQGFLMSLTSVSSSGEYAGVLLYSENAGYLSLAIMILISNMRYILMSCAFSQRFAPDATLLQRLIIGFGLTDEIFGLGIMTPGYLKPSYMYAAICTAVPGWAIGTYIGVIAGDILPEILSQSLNVAIFGMFLAIIIPPGKKDKHVLFAVLVSFASSLLGTVLPVISSFSSGTRVMILTLIIASVIAVLFPVEEV
ncbi:MAG: AzlC family ABC transporter permease [Eubacteriales bacterium]|nr:AzlC family ABC transporter permease [Eubacteriales bacterium]